jgi:hypothetical protein
VTQDRPSFLNIRVADIRAVYEEWSAKGAGLAEPSLPGSAADPAARRMPASAEPAEREGKLGVT